MKRFLFLAFVLSIFFSYSVVWGSDWKQYLVIDKCGHGISVHPIGNDRLYLPLCYPYYDAESITYPSKGIVRVWVKFIPKEGDEISTMAKAKGEVVNLLEINCRDRIVHTLKETGYILLKEGTGEEYGGIGTQPGDLELIEPESPIEVLYKIVCKKLDK